ncbi:cell wall-binding repeat-containing protein [Pseudalkalibacillus hwajinpoensis]|uniref:cell wall-binding repeat-containing protein n=1 Tax=Guptibacillus hwajinpoensis TaxID=208199 RepID=UPI001CFE284C|nr:cell wall-binding repeat-containing protein [Pseudalkalibacillus hwajinpoensis]
MRKALLYLLVALLLGGLSLPVNGYAASDEHGELKNEINKVRQEKGTTFSKEELDKIQTQVKEKLATDPNKVKTLTDYWENEPNDSFNQANLLNLDDTVYGTFEWEDVDVYQVEVKNPMELLVSGTAQRGIDLGFLLADGYGNWLEPDGSDVYDGIQVQLYVIPEGTYYIGALDLNGGGSDSMYALSAMNMEYIQRISGDDRYETAIEIARAGWPDGADNVVLATGTTFPDALAGAPLAFQMDAPILLTPKAKLDNRVRDLMKEFGVKKVTILGGPNAVSSAVENELKQELKLSVNRIQGENRYETAAAIAETLLPNRTAVVAYGGNFPDALSMAPYAAMYGHPIFLTDQNELSQATKKAMSNYTKTYVIGGPNAISEKVARQLPGPTRIQGNDRYETSIAVAKKLDLPTGFVFIATGEGFADALTGSVLAAKFGAPTILTKKNQLPDSTYQFFKEEQTTDYIILGGESAVGTGVENDIFSVE